MTHKPENCPFCGNECEIESTTFGDSAIPRHYRVSCKVNQHALDCWEESEELAVKEWNNRPEEIQAMREKILLTESVLEVSTKMLIEMGIELAQLRADKARLVEALEQTDDKMMASDIWVGTGSLNFANKEQHELNQQLLTEMKQK